jgi:hypothetical protein
MMRHPQWEQRLHEYIRDNIERGHAWGWHDCLLHVAAATEAVTGHDPALGHKGEYDSRAKAYRYLRQKFKVDSPEQLLDMLFAQKLVGFAQRGDIVLCHLDGVELDEGGEPVPGDVPGVCLGSFAMVVGEEGMIRIPRGERWLKAWAVGDHHSGPEAMVNG